MAAEWVCNFSIKKAMMSPCKDEDWRRNGEEWQSVLSVREWLCKNEEWVCWVAGQGQRCGVVILRKGNFGRHWIISRFMSRWRRIYYLGFLANEDVDILFYTNVDEYEGKQRGWDWEYYVKTENKIKIKDVCKGMIIFFNMGNRTRLIPKCQRGEVKSSRARYWRMLVKTWHQ